MPEVRDFIYLNQRRVLSFGSQLLEGLANTIVTKEKQDDDTTKNLDLQGAIGGELKIGGDSLALLQNILSWIGEAKVNVNGEIKPQVKSSKSITEEKQETRLLDHFKFSLLRNALIEQDLLINLDEYKSHQWQNGKVSEDLEPGDFIELTCRVNFMDVTHLENVAETLEKIIEISGQMQIGEKVSQMVQNGMKIDKAMNKVTDNPMQLGYEMMKNFLGENSNPMEINAMIDMMKTISSGGLATVPMHIIARPKKASSKATNFVAPIRTEYLLDEKEELIFKYGYKPDQDWKLLAQICKKPKKKKRKLNFNTPEFSKTKQINEIIKQITNLFTDLSSVLGMHAFVKHPNVSVNLVGLYR